MTPNLRALASAAALSLAALPALAQTQATPAAPAGDIRPAASRSRKDSPSRKS